MPRTRSTYFAGVLIVSLAALTGCGHAPTAPLLDSSIAQAGPQVAAFGPSREDPGSTPIEPLDAPTTTQVVSTTSVNGAVGKSIDLGNVHLVIPKHAFRGKADVTVTVPDPTKLEARLSISPADKNRLYKPLLLQFDAQAVGLDCRTTQILWFDVTLNQWVEVPTSFDFASGMVSAEITRFSKYKATCELKRVGW